MDVTSLVAKRVQNPTVDRKLSLTGHSYKKYLLLYLNTLDDIVLGSLEVFFFLCQPTLETDLVGRVCHFQQCSDLLSGATIGPADLRSAFEWKRRREGIHCACCAQRPTVSQLGSNP